MANQIYRTPFPLKYIEFSTISSSHTKNLKLKKKNTKRKVVFKQNYLYAAICKVIDDRWNSVIKL